MITALVAKKLDSGKKELLFQSILAFIVRILGAGSAFLLNLIIARTLPPHQAGYYFLAFTVVQALSMISQIGLSNTFVRFIGGFKAEDKWLEASSVYKTGIFWVLLLGLFLSISLFMGSSWLSKYIIENQEFAPILQVMAFSIIPLALINLNAHSLQALGDVVKSVCTMNILGQLSLAALLLFGFASNAKMTAFLYCITSLFAAIVSLLWWLKKPRIQLRGTPSFSMVTLWQSCAPLWVVEMMALGVQWSGQLVSGAYLPPEELAFLAVAQRTALLTSFILIAVNLVVAPKYAALYKQGKYEKLKDIAVQSTRLMVLFALPVIGFMLIFPEWLMSLFGEQYKSGANLLRILALGQFVNVITGSVVYLLTMSGHERDLRNIVFISGPMAVLLAVILVPLFGVTGAAVSTAVALATQNLLAVFMVKKRIGINTLTVW